MNKQNNPQIQQLTIRSTVRVLLLVSALCIAFASTTTPAAQRTWNGAGADINWGTAANWGGTAPVNGDDLVFAGTTRLTSSNSIVGLRINSISYTSGGFTNFGQALTITNGIVDSAGGNTNIIAMTLGGAQTFQNQSGLTTLLGGTINMSNNDLTLSSSGGGNLFVNGVLSGSNNAAAGAKLNLNIQDGNVRLGGANTFIGNVNVNSGTLMFNNAGAVPSGSFQGNLLVASGATANLNSQSPTINGLDGAGVVDNLAGTATYTLNVGAGNSNGVFSGTIQNTSGTISIAKNGTGTQTLSGGNTFNGGVTVNGGNLTVSGGNTYVGQTLINAGTFMLASGGSIVSTNIRIVAGGLFDVAGAGGYSFDGNLIGGRSSGFATDVNGNLTLLGGNITPMPGILGTLTINGNLTLAGNPVSLNYDLKNVPTVGGGTNDLIVVNGTLDISGGTTAIKINPVVGALSGTYTLIASSNLVVGSTANLSFDSPRGLSVSFDTTTQPSNVLMTASGSPNPASIVWAGSGSGGNWDVLTSQNWLSNGVPDYFYNLDNATFNDAAGSANATVGMPGAVSPGSVTISNNSVNYTIGLSSDPGLISGTGGLTKTGSGTATLQTANSYTGPTTVNGGILTLGTTLASPNFVLYNGVAPGNLVLGGGGLFMTDAANITYQLNANLTLNPGGSSMAMRSRQSSSSYIYQIGTITRNVGSTITFNNIQQKAASPQVGLLITNQPAVNGILGGYATIFQTDWVVPVGTGLGSIAYTGYQTNNATPSAWGSVSNIAVTATPSASLNNTTINSLKMTAAATVTINSGQTLTLTSGGLLVPNGAAASTITGGAIQGAASADLVVMQHSSAGALTVGSVIANNGGATALTKVGQGTVILTGNNTYSGVTYINGFEVNGAGGTGPTTIAAGTLQIGSGGTSGGISNTPSIQDNGTLAFNRSDTIGYSVPISGVGGIKQQGSGTTILTADNSFSGPVTITAGTLQIGNGGSTGSFGNAANVANAGSLVFNRTGSLAYAGQISGIGSLAVQGGLTLTLNTNETYSGATTISGSSLVLGPSGSISNSPLISIASTFDVSGLSGGIVLNGAGGGQVLAGSGTGGVKGNVTSGGNTRLSPGGDGVIGTLTLSNNLTLNSGTVTIDVNGGSRDLLDVKGNLDMTSGTIGINNLGGPIPNGTYKLISYGTKTGSAGVLTISGFSQAGQLASLNDTGSEIDLVVVTGFGANLTWLGDGAANIWNLIGAMNFTNSSGVVTNFHNNDNVNFTDAGAANSTVNLSGSLAPAAVVANSSTDYTLQGNGGISGGSSLIKAGPDNLIILSTNNFTGPTTVSAGTLTLGNGTSDGTLGSGNVTNNAAVVVNEAGNENLSGAISGNGSLTISGAGTITLLGNNGSFSGATTINGGIVQVGAGAAAGTLGAGSVANNTALVINRSGSLSVSANISGGGVVSNVGPGTVTFSGANSYAGGIVIASGTVKGGSAGAIPSGPSAGNVVLDGGASAAGTLDLNGFNLNINGLSGANGTVLGAVINSVGPATNTLTLGNGDATATNSGAIKDNNGSGGKVAIVKVGSGTQAFNITTSLGNTYSGGTVISNGTLEVITPGGNTPLNAAANSVAFGSGAVTFLGTNGVLNLAGNTSSQAGLNGGSGYFPGFGNTINIPAGQAGTVNPPQRGALNGSLVGSGTMYYNPAFVRGEFGADWSAFTGQVYLSGNAGGQMGLNTSSGFQRVYMTTNVVLYGRIAGTPTIPIGELAGGDDSDSIVSTSPSNAGGAAANFMIGGLNTTTNFNGRIRDSVGIIKIGTGTLTLTNTTIDYTGTTTVSNGVLVLAGSLPASGTWGLAAPGLLDISANITSPGLLSIGASTVQTIRGNGTLLGSLDVQASGVVVPGFTNAIGTLNVTNTVTLAGTVYMELNRTNAVGGTNDQIAAQSITLGGSLVVTNIGPALHVGDTFRLFKSTAPLSGSISATLPATDGNNYAYTWTDNTAVNGTITVASATLLVNTTPTNITFVINGSNLEISWPADHVGWRLQVQTNPITVGLQSNWFDVPGSASVNSVTNPINPANGSVFYRMVYP
jgi:fibronectin-binding autotransporter adhesin